MINNRFAFWTTSKDCSNVSADFGCAVQGLADDRQWVDPKVPLASVWDLRLPGTVVSGNYDAVLNNLSSLGYTPVVCIVFFSKPTGIETFINRFVRIFPNVPLIGGGSAIREGQLEGELWPPAEDVVLLAADNGNYELESLNIYDKKVLTIEIKKTSLRDFELLRVLPDGEWQNALHFFHNLTSELGFENNNFESVTFCDKNDRNIHFSISGNSVHAGANLPDDDILFLRVLNSDHVEERVAQFISDQHSLIFGCAGIRSLIRTPLYTGSKSLAGFMFGEVVILNGMVMFGNLMLAKLKLKA
jgi:hypothetical protein